MRCMAVAALGFALAACGGGNGGELAAGNSQLSQAQIDAALGPADQSTLEDAVAPGNGDNAVDSADNRTVAANSEVE